MPTDSRHPADSTDAMWRVTQQSLADAEQYVDAGSRVPPMRTLSALSRAIATPFVKLYVRLAQLVVREQQSFNQETVRTLRAITDATRSELQAIRARLDQAEHAQAARVHALETALTTAIANANAAMVTRLEHELHTHRTALDQSAQHAVQRVEAAEYALFQWRSESVESIAAHEKRTAEELGRLRTHLLAYERQLAAFDDAVGAGTAAGTTAPGDDVRLPARLDAFYLAFEDRFRGPREEVRARLAVHLPTVRDAGAGTPERAIVDLGCGRGEWLELLAAEGLVACGVDANVATVAETRARGVDVVQADVLAYLRDLPDASCGAVTAFHLIEHLPFPALVTLVDEIVRVLQPGGVTILETPNPTNLQVGAATFYIDPTHGRPLHPETMRFLLASRGLARVDVRPLHPIAEGRLPDDGDPIAARLNQHLYGPQDYAVIGHRP
jgi:O-antigen chain-terminating methyltransferase